MLTINSIIIWTSYWWSKNLKSCICTSFIRIKNYCYNYVSEWFVCSQDKNSLDHELQLLALLGVDLHGDLHGTVGYEAGQLPLLQLLAVHRDQGVLVTPGEKYFIFTTEIFANDNNIGNSDRCLHDLTINVGWSIGIALLKPGI